MSLLDLLNGAQGGDGIAALARQFGMSPEQAGGLAGMLAPAIGGAARQQAGAGNLGAVLGQLMGEGQGRYFDNPAEAATPAGRQQGEAFLEQLFGSSAATGHIAQAAATRSGLDLSTVMQFLPALAAMLQGGLQKQVPDQTLRGMMDAAPAAGAGGGAGMAEVLGGLFGNMQAGGAAPSGAGGPGGALGGLMGALAGAMGGSAGGSAGATQAQAGAGPGGLGGLMAALGGAAGADPSASGQPGLGALAALLDADRDGNPLDDILQMVMKR
jgi:hypothetical protein